MQDYKEEQIWSQLVLTLSMDIILLENQHFSESEAEAQGTDQL